MKKAFSPLLLAVLLGAFSPGSGSLYAQADAPALPSQATSALRQGNFEGVQSALIAEIARKCEGKTPEQIYADPSLMGLMTLSDLIAQTGADKMTELYARSNRKYARFLNAFIKDTEWMRLYLSAGLIPTNSEVGLRVLGDIWNECGSEPDFRKYLSLSTGIAAAWGAGNYAGQLQEAERFKAGKRCDPVWRYKFFKKAHQDGKLAANFMTLKPWEIRFVAGGVWSDSSLKFLQEEINLPPNSYDDACWRAEYSGTSEFGESIQGPLYYTAWGEAGQAENTVLHGGVCGALSHVGATAAAARGIPAYPVGQPGHCAYGFRPARGEWKGGFGGPDGGPHNYIFPGDAPTNMRLMEAAFASDEKVDKAYQQASVARGLALAGKKTEAKQAWGDALKTMPFNYYFHKEFQKFATENNLYTPQQWYDYGVSVLGFMKTHGFAALDIVKDIQDQFLNAGGDDDQARLKWFAMVNEALAYTPSSWKLDITPVLEEQSKKLQKLESNARLMSSAIDIHLNHGDGTNFGKVMEWAIKNFANGKDDTFSKAFAMAAANPSASASGQSASGELKPTEDKLREAYGKAIIAAEEARSLSAARSISEAAKQFRQPSPGPAPHELKCPEGELVSDKGYLRLSTTSSWDKPCDHLGVLTREGGMFHTAEEEKPTVIVELPEKVDLSGLLLVKNQGNEWRVNKVKVSRSVDGATWFDLAETDKMPDQWRVDTPDSPPARWIKVESIPQAGSKQVFHLRNILLFSKNK